MHECRVGKKPPPPHTRLPACAHARACSSIFKTEVEVIPPELCQLTGLVRLALYENRIGAVPPEIGRLASLQEL
eukprot:59155-Chlamydomonas_euryale.AAC.1